MLKKILLIGALFSTLAFSCGDKTIHESAEMLITQGIIAKKEGKIITVDPYMISLLFLSQGKTEEEVKTLGLGIIFGFQTYANNHGYTVKIKEN